MSKKILNTVLCIISLVSGGIIYLIFRENTYIARYVDEVINIESVRKSFSILDSRIIRHYIPDFLWAFSLSCGLNILFDSFRLNSFIVFSLGVGWEVLQYLNIVNGTGDIIDIMMYLTACILAVTINILLFKEKKNEKTH